MRNFLAASAPGIAFGGGAAAGVDVAICRESAQILRVWGANGSAVLKIGGPSGGFDGGPSNTGILLGNSLDAGTPVGGGVLYSFGGALIWKGSAGTRTIIAPA
jgi:hypothetical protein